MDSTINTSCYAVSLATVGMVTITADDVMRWIYMGIAIIGLLIPLVNNVMNIFKDKKVTSDELKDIQDAVQKTVEELNKLQEKNKKEED